MENRLKLIDLDELKVGVWLNTTKDPPRAEWTEACAKFAASVRAADSDISRHRIFVVSDNGSPSAAQRRELFEDALGGYPVPTAVVNRAMTNPVRRGLAAAMHLLKPHYNVFEPKDVLLALDHIGVARPRFAPIWKTLRLLQASVAPVHTLRFIAETLALPLEPLRPSEFPPSSVPPPK